MDNNQFNNNNYNNMNNNMNGSYNNMNQPVNNSYNPNPTQPVNNGYNNMSQPTYNNHNQNVQPSNGNINSSNGINLGNNKNMKIIIIAVVGVLAIVGLYFIIHSMTSKEYKGGIDFEKEYQEKIERESKELANKVNVEYQKLPDGDYLIIIENKANKAIFPECTVEFYDDTTLTSTKEAYVKSGYILPNQKGYAILYNERDIKYNKLVPKVVSSYYEMKIYDANKLPYTVEKKSDNLLITVTNNTGEALDSINVDVLYYDSEDKIIGYGSDRISSNVTAGAANFVKIYLPEDENFNEIAYSRYEVIVSAEEKF